MYIYSLHPLYTLIHNSRGYSIIYTLNQGHSYLNQFSESEYLQQCPSVQKQIHKYDVTT